MSSSTAQDRYPPAPRHLSEARRRLWRSVVREYELPEQGLQLLKGACELLDRAEEARVAIKANGGPIAHDRFGQAKEHAAVKVERDSKQAAARLLREIGCAQPGDPDDFRPPSRPGGY